MSSRSRPTAHLSPGQSQVFTVSGKITSYYVNDGSTTGDVYTTAPGSDSNDGLTPATPKATIQALLNEYALGAGDIIYVDTGTYDVTTTISLGVANSGTSTSDTFNIIGPTSGPGAVINRGNLNSGQDVFDIQGGSFITLEDLTITGAFNGVEIGGASHGVQLLNDTVVANGDVGILVDVNSGGTATAVTGLVIEADTINGNGLDNQPSGTYYGGNQDGVLGAARAMAPCSSSTTRCSATTMPVFISQGGYDGAGTSTIEGGAYYQQTGLYGGSGIGIDDSTGSLIENVQVYANNADGIYSANNAGYSNTAPGTITGDSVFGNRRRRHRGAHRRGHRRSRLRPDQHHAHARSSSTTRRPAPATQSTAALSGIFLGSGAIAHDNLVYDNSGDGMYYTASPPAAITANTVYGDAIGIAGDEYYTGQPSRSPAT